MNSIYQPQNAAYAAKNVPDFDKYGRLPLTVSKEGICKFASAAEAKDFIARAVADAVGFIPAGQVKIAKEIGRVVDRAATLAMHPPSKWAEIIKKSDRASRVSSLCYPDPERLLEVKIFTAIDDLGMTPVMKEDIKYSVKGDGKWGLVGSSIRRLSSREKPMDGIEYTIDQFQAMKNK